jgi:glutathionylspermidine synthase
MNFSSHTAGIASEAKLLENGINNIILLEAKDQIGGRTLFEDDITEFAIEEEQWPILKKCFPKQMTILEGCHLYDRMELRLMNDSVNIEHARVEFANYL